MSKLRSIQFLRAVAVLAVVLAHDFRSGRGTSGVDLFFVISGFIIARVAAGRSPVEFAKARFWRIYPVYWLAALPFVGWQLTYNAADAAKIAATLSLWPAWAGNYQEPLLPVAWSLYFEILFYAAVSLSLWNTRVAMFAGVALCILGAVHPTAATAFVLSPISLEFVAGYCLAHVRRFSFALPALLLGLVLLFSPARAFEGATMLDGSQAAIRLMMYGLPAVMVVYGALGLEDAFAARWVTPLLAIGDASYSIYLTHLIPVRVLPAWSAEGRLLAALALGFAFHFGVERTLGRPPKPKARRSSEAVAGPAIATEG